MRLALVMLSLVMTSMLLVPVLASGGEEDGTRDKAEKKPAFIQPFMGYPDAPPFEVVPKKKDPDLHPCADCHQWEKSDPTPRPLDEPHDFTLAHGIHGKGQFWCLTCHHLDEDGGLHTVEGRKLDFDQGYLICGQCHTRQARDWYFGAHGKRVDSWQGKRRILNCTVCHYQHDTAIKPRKPQPPPPVRAGLSKPVQATEKVPRVWDRHAQTGGNP